MGALQTHRGKGVKRRGPLAPLTSPRAVTEHSHARSLWHRPFVGNFLLLWIHVRTLFPWCEGQCLEHHLKMKRNNPPPASSAMGFPTEGPAVLANASQVPFDFRGHSFVKRNESLLSSSKKPTKKKAFYQCLFTVQNKSVNYPDKLARILQIYIYLYKVTIS